MTVINESKVIAEAIQALFQAMSSEFTSTSVVISDWTALDLSEDNAPWVIINQPGLSQGIDNTFGCDSSTWTVDCGIHIPFNDWQPDMVELARLRDATLSQFTVNRNLNTTDVTASVQAIADLVPSFPFRLIYYGDGTADMPDMIALDIVLTITTQE